MKDRCKLFCRVAGSTAYYQLRDRVIDGTPCGPDTNDICVQGLCRVSLESSVLALGRRASAVTSPEPILSVTLPYLSIICGFNLSPSPPLPSSPSLAGSKRAVTTC